MSVTRNLPRSRALLRRGHRWHRTVIVSATLAAVTLLCAGCGGHSVRVKHIQHAPGHSASQQAQSHTT
jgi:hypothetical protein